MNERKCPICSSVLFNIAPIAGSPNHMQLFECPRCGSYEISPLASAMFIMQLSQLQIANISGWMRENSLNIYGREEIEYLISISEETPAVARKAEKLLLYLSKKYPVPGHYFEMGNKDKYQEYLGVSWAQERAELRFIIKQYLADCMQYLEVHPTVNSMYTITPAGWAHIEGLKYINSESQIGFIAMWFDQSLNSLLKDAIEPAIRDAGYEPKRIDKHEHINRIDDEILAMIKRSKFVVADFTGQRGGVYFESGYALGFGLPVFWLCKKEDIVKEEIHFDTRQYNYISWEGNKLPEAKSALQYRIERILGRGKYVK